MQFIPSTWAEYGVDANGDGLADPLGSRRRDLRCSQLPQSLRRPRRHPRRRLRLQPLLGLRRRSHLHYANTYSQQAAATSTTPAGSPTGKAAANAAVARARADRHALPVGRRNPGVAARAAPAASPRPPTPQQGSPSPASRKTSTTLAPRSRPACRLQPGDLVFFGTSTSNVTHVGIVINSTEMIDAPHTGALVRIEPYDWADYLGATQPWN